MIKNPTGNSRLTVSSEQGEGLEDTGIRVVAKSVVSEGERSVALDHARGTIINTGEIQGNVTLINVSLSQDSSHEPSLTTDNIGSALNLVRLNQSLSSELSRRIASELESAREVFREGETRKGFADVQALLESPNWPVLDDPLRAMVLRVLANMSLSLKGKNGISEAQSYLDEARRFDPNDSDLPVRVRMKLLQEGHEAALDDLIEPTTVDAFNLRVGILIETDQTDEALAALASPPAGILLDTESNRLRALALLLNCDLDGARTAISEPLHEMPRRQNVRLAAAVIDYYSSLSALAVQPRLVAYPHPLNPAMVKRDNESQERLKNAAHQFADVAAQMEPGSAAQKEVEAWQLACLANISDGENEVVDLCRSALVRDPSNFRVLAWVLYRGYDIDLGPSGIALKQLLEGYVDEESLCIQYVLALLGIHLKNEAPEAVFRLLDEKRPLFESSGNSDLWWYWRGQTLVMSSQAEAALEDLTEIKQRKLRDLVKLLALCEIANRDGNWQQVVDYLEAALGETEDPEFLIHLCEVKAQIGDWNYVADRAEEFCDKVGTASSAYFAISAARKADRNQLCLHFLNKYQHVFPGGALPADLRRVGVYCKLRTKDIGGALSDAQKLVGENDSVENIITLLDVLRAKGDLASIEATARRLRSRDLTALQCLQLAALLRVENSDLAREFWRRAKDDAQNDKSLAVVAVDLAFKLGLDSEVAPLWGRIHEVAQSEDDSVQLFDMEQVLAMMRQNQTRIEKIQELYGNADAPLAFVAQRIKRPLIDIFNGLAEENQGASTCHLRPRLWIRHGARLLPPSENFQRSNEWRLHLDVTALILADHLGLLDKIEETFSPLRISGKTPQALLAQRNELLDIQQSRLDNSRIIVNLVDHGKLRSFKNEAPISDLAVLQRTLAESELDLNVQTNPTALPGQKESEAVKSEEPNYEKATAANLSVQLGDNRVAMLAAALNHDGFAVGLLPLHAYGNNRLTLLDLPGPLRNRIVNCRAVVDSLRGHDRISDQMRERVLRGLGQEGNPNISPASPLIGSKLYLMEGAADVLAGASVLERACDSFEVAVSENCISEARGTLQEYSRREAVAARAQRLVLRISAGLEDGRYEFVVISDERLKETADFDESESLDFAATLELFRYQAANWDILWIDDRAINKHPFRDGAPIIGINEILVALRQREVIDKQEYYDLVLKLRAQNFRYVPIDDDEILNHIRQASLRNGVLSETPSLAILRRYLASCLLDTDYLQPELTPEGLRNPASENPFVTNCLIAVTEAVAACWADESVSDEIARARADWIFDNFYVGLFGLLHLKGRNPPGTLPVLLLGRDIAGLLMKAVTIGDPLKADQRKERRRAYFDWLTARVTAARFRSDPTVLRAVAREVERMFAGMSQIEQQPDNQGLVARVLLQGLFMDLPDVLRAELNLDERTREWLSITTFPAAEVGGFTFDAREFVSAVESALSGNSTVIKPQGADTELRFAPIEDPQVSGEKINIPAVAVLNVSNQRVAVLGDPVLNVLSPEVEVRKTTLKQFRDWFDGSEAEFEEETNEIVGLIDLQQRLDRVHRLHSESSEVFYQSIEQKLRRRDLFSNDLSPVSARILLKRFRLPNSFEGSFSELWEGAATRLLDDLGIEQSIERCSCLPVNVPKVIVAGLAGLGDDERNEIFARQFAQSGSPVTKLQLANLALRSSEQDENAQAKEFLDSLYGQQSGEADFRAFAAILSFVSGEIEGWRDSEQLSPPIRLAIIWAHATRVHNIFHSVGFPAADIADMFQLVTRQLNGETILRAPELWDDCLHPHRFDRTIFLTHGVSRVFSGIDSKKLAQIGIIPAIEDEIQLDVAGTKIPKLPLLRDSNLEGNGLDSILGGDRAEALGSVLKLEEVALLSSSRLREMVEQALDQILTDRNHSAWTTVVAVLGDLPIYADLRAKFQEVLRIVEIDEAFMTSPIFAHAALSTAANQIRHWGDEDLRSATRGKILDAIKFETGSGTGPATEDAVTDADQREKRIGSLVDAALKLSIVPRDLKATGQNIADILETISGLWPDFSRRFAPAISAFVWELPVDVVVPWWHLLLKLRATMNEGL